MATRANKKRATAKSRQKEPEKSPLQLNSCFKESTSEKEEEIIQKVSSTTDIAKSTHPNADLLKHIETIVEKNSAMVKKSFKKKLDKMLVDIVAAVTEIQKGSDKREDNKSQFDDLFPIADEVQFDAFMNQLDDEQYLVSVVSISPKET